MFYYKIFTLIANIKLEKEFILNDCLFLKYLIQQIRSDEKFISICNDEKVNFILNDYLKLNIDDFGEFKAKIIWNIIKKFISSRNSNFKLVFQFKTRKLLIRTFGLPYFLPGGSGLPRRNVQIQV